MAYQSELCWNVKVGDFNTKKIDDYNILKYSEEKIKRLKKESKNKEEFSEKLDREMRWSYWSKCEWEIVIRKTSDEKILLLPWPGQNDIVDVSNDTSFDWAGFADQHIKNQCFKNEAKIDVYDQLRYCWNNFVNYLWGTRLKYERDDPKFHEGE